MDLLIVQSDPPYLRPYQKALAVVADTEVPCAPCGACRQVISEFGIPRIIMANLRGDYTVVELEGLLPFRFGADNI